MFCEAAKGFWEIMDAGLLAVFCESDTAEGGLLLCFDTGVAVGLPGDPNGPAKPTLVLLE